MDKKKQDLNHLILILLCQRHGVYLIWSRRSRIFTLNRLFRSGCQFQIRAHITCTKKSWLFQAHQKRRSDSWFGGYHVCWVVIPSRRLFRSIALSTIPIPLVYSFYFRGYRFVSSGRRTCIRICITIFCSCTYCISRSLRGVNSMSIRNITCTL